MYSPSAGSRRGTPTFDRPTGPHHAQWHVADGTRSMPTKDHLGDNIMHSAIVLGDRLLVEIVMLLHVLPLL